MSKRLQDLVCIVTGGASGIGKAISQAISHEGGIVAVIDKVPIKEKRIYKHQVDVSNTNEVDNAVVEIYKKFGQIDVLVNCAAIWVPGSVTNTKPDIWDQVFAVNVRGPYLMSRVVVPYMEKNQKGSIIHIASNYGLVGGLNSAAYCASKGALIALTKAMALDHAGNGIRVNCICPGTIDTTMSRMPLDLMNLGDRRVYEAKRVARHPIGRIGRPEEIAPAVIYLANENESSFVTGAIISIDGGYTAQ